MDVHLAANIIILVILLLLSGFFSSSETALTSVNPARIEAIAKDEKDNNRNRAIRLLKIIEDKQKMLSAILIGNNLVNILASAIATALAIDLFGSAGVGIATGILTLLILVFGEITPKSIAALESTRTSLRCATAIYALMWVLTPVIAILNTLVRLIKRLLGVTPTEDERGMTSDELRIVVSHSHEQGSIEEDEKEYIENVFDFTDSLVREVMTPRIDIAVMKKDYTYEELLEVFSEEMYTRYPVCGESTDDILGIINVKETLLYDRSTPFNMEDYMREAYLTFEHKNTAELFDEMRSSSIPMAVVLDEYGALAGIVTLEDLLEELVGEIRDEFDEDEVDDITKLSDREFDVLGSANLDDICSDLNLDFTSDDYDTIGGYVIGLLEHFPKAGETFVTDSGVTLRVVSVKDSRIQKVRIRLPHPLF